MDKIKAAIENLEKRRTELLYVISEREDINLPQVILGMVSEVRTITNTLKILQNETKENHNTSYA